MGTETAKPETAHTPGPWEVLGPYPTINVGVMIDGDCGGPDPEPPVYEAIAQIYHDPNYKKEASDETKANANLIAAAPDLLAACRELLAMIDDVPADPTPGLSYDENDRVFARYEFEALRQAIAKATGRTV